MHSLVMALPSEGIIDLGIGLSTDVKELLLAVLSAAVIFIIVKAVWASGGAIGATVVALLSGGLILWGVNNLDVVQGWFGDELNAGAPVSRVVDPGTLAAFPVRAAEPGPPVS